MKLKILIIISYICLFLISCSNDGLPSKFHFNAKIIEDNAKYTITETFEKDKLVFLRRESQNSISNVEKDLFIDIYCTEEFNFIKQEWEITEWSYFEKHAQIEKNPPQRCFTNLPDKFDRSEIKILLQAGCNSDYCYELTEI